LGSLLVAPERVWEILGTGLRSDDFHRERNAWIFAAIAALADSGPAESINQITVTRQLARDGAQHLKEAGGRAYLSGLVTDLPTPHGAEYYAGIVRDCAHQRRLITAAGAIAGEAYRSADSPADVTARAVERLMACNGAYVGGRRSLKEMFAGYLELRDSPAAGVSLGFPSLEEAVPMLAAGDLMLIAASTSVGKTAFSLQIARNVALYQGKRVAVFSVEMGDDALFRRLLSLQTGISNDRLVGGMMRGDLAQYQQRAINDAGGRLCDAPLEILDSTGWTVQRVSLEARRIQAQKGLDLLVIDYLQLLASGVKTDNLTHEVSLISRGVKEIARSLRVPVIAVSQLNRNAGDDKPPELHHLLQSGSLERDADIGVLLNWANRQKTTTRPVQVRVAKNRNGPVMSWSGAPVFTFEASTGRFVDPLEEA
jgi:replicative DNA helicase